MTTFLTENTNNEFIDVTAETAQSYSGETTYNVKTKAFGEDFDLHLKKLPSVFSRNFQFTLLEVDNKNNPVYKQVKPKYGDEPVFRDSGKNSILYLEFKNGELQLEGSLTPELSIVHSSKIGMKNFIGNHVVVKTNYRRTFIDKTYSFKWEYRGTPINTSDEAVEIPDPVRPELLAIVDYKNAQRLEFDIGQIQKYLAIFWHAVNTRYDLVTNPKIQLLVVGAVITKDVSLQPYIEQSRVTYKGKKILHLDYALAFLNQFLYQNIDNLPDFDIAMLMTGEDMASQDRDTGSYSPEVAGAAYIASACAWAPDDNTLHNAGMAEDMMPFFDGVLNFAHEIAHILGAAHDGDPPVSFLPGHPGAEECPWSDGYLMSYKFGSKNHVRWSDCTIKQFRFFIRQPIAKCLREMSSHSNMTLNSTLPGQIVSLDDQCRAVLGSDGIYFDVQNSENICAILYCTRKGEVNGQARGPALEGSPCGNTSNKWCRNGECVRRPS